MAKTRKRKAATVAGVGVLTAALLLGGTFAWQSISQMALNENAHEINPGARLHDDYDGTNGIKRVYVENFAEDDVSIIARVRLDEYMEIGATAGHKNDVTEKTANGNFIAPYDNGSVTVTESVDGSGNVTLTIETLPYKEYKTDTVTADDGNGTPQSLSAGTDGTYSYTAASGTKVTVKVQFTKDTTYQGLTIAAPKPLAANADINDKATWTTYIPKTDSTTGAFVNDNTSAFRKYVTLTLGSDSNISYMPTFNKNKDSLKADINGTYEGKGLGTPFDDYVDYSLTANQKKTADAEYDIDYNTIDEATPQAGVNIKKVSEEHQVKTISASKSKVISMQQWKDTYKMAPGDYWIYDTDGWAYWGNLLESGDADNVTGLLLSGNKMTGVPEDNWYYGMNVVAQFATAADLGKNNNTGFYTDADEKPSGDAEALLALLGAGNAKITADDGTFKNGVLQLTSGDDVTLKTSDITLFDTEGTTAEWKLLGNLNEEEDINDEILTLQDTGNGTAKLTGKAPGEAYVFYSDGEKFAALKVKVERKTYTIEKANLEEAKSKGIVSYDDEDNTKLRIKGYFKEGNNYYQVAIGTQVFRGDTSLQGLTLEEGIVSVAKEAFFNCSNISGRLEIPKTVEWIGYSSFENLAVDEIILNEGLKSIGDAAFMKCGNVKSLKIPATVTSISYSAFTHMTIPTVTIAEGNTSFVVKDDVLYSADMTILYWYPQEKTDTDFTVPGTVKKIIASAFRGCNNLQTVTIPEGVEELTSTTFYECKNLTKVSIPASVTKIGHGIFAGTTNLTTIDLAAGNQSYVVVDNMLYDKDMTTLYSCPGGVSGTDGKIVIPDDIKAISAYAFMGNKNLTAIVIPASMESIHASAFEKCSALTDVYYTGTEEQWNASSFKDDNYLKNKTLHCNSSGE